jgi:hypothetical protein
MSESNQVLLAIAEDQRQATRPAVDTYIRYATREECLTLRRAIGERLRELGGGQPCDYRPGAREESQLRAERDRYRAALELIANAPEGPDIDCEICGGAEMAIACECEESPDLKAIAAKALEGEYDDHTD